MLPPSLLFMDVLRTGWGAHLQDLTPAGVWTEEELNLHINLLEMKSVQLALNAFKDWIMVESVVLMSNNTTIPAYIREPGGTVSWVMCSPVQEIYLNAQYTLGKKNILMDQLSCLCI